MPVWTDLVGDCIRRIKACCLQLRRGGGDIGVKQRVFRKVLMNLK